MLAENKINPVLRFKNDDGGDYSDWKNNIFGNTANKNIRWSITGGPFGSDLKTDDYTESGIRIIQLQNIGDGSFKDKYKIYTSKLKADSLLACNIFAGEIIISKMGDPVARACLMPETEERYLMASDGIRYVPDNKQFDKNFMFFLINHRNFRKRAVSLSTGSTRKRIGLTDLKKIDIQIPSKPEQQKIAIFLSSVDTKIEQLSKKQNLLTQYKKGMMQKLFNQTIRFKADDGSDYPD
jgi:type I restriction enzyme S subunit